MRSPTPARTRRARSSSMTTLSQRSGSANRPRSTRNRAMSLGRRFQGRLRDHRPPRRIRAGQVGPHHDDREEQSIVHLGLMTRRAQQLEGTVRRLARSGDHDPVLRGGTSRRSGRPTHRPAARRSARAEASPATSVIEHAPGRVGSRSHASSARGDQAGRSGEWSGWELKRQRAPHRQRSRRRRVTRSSRPRRRWRRAGRSC